MILYAADIFTAFVFAYFCFLKYWVALFRLKSIILNVLHQMMFLCLVFFELYSAMSQDLPSSLKY